MDGDGDHAAEASEVTVMDDAMINADFDSVPEEYFQSYEDLDVRTFLQSSVAILRIFIDTF